ncbi:hypothetical protein STIUS_v1c00820 [Spiroplasma sp. TIUS-1]|uniref:ABC transporter permease n=1 Tax=Spiroplasma sp. TIUS-1 TaxID=216963 RepID=UPI001397F185|nr:ABC transporter permease [Spiroplasma sp. TIUS-1]QHX35637.1 hypothetical protein STIUS_v1c00820 [Spiroplasma sp. TIUS-1]
MKSFNILFKMQFDHYRQDIVTITYGWTLTFLTLFIWLTFKQTNPNAFAYDPFVLASAIGVGTIRNCIHATTRILFNYKNQGFLNKIYSTPISKWNFLASIILFNVLINFIITTLLFTTAMLYADQRNNLNDVNWGMFLIGYLMLVITCILFSFLIVEYVKTNDKASFWSNVFFYTCVWFLGLGVPISEISQYEFFTYLTYLFPQKYAINIMQAGWIGATDFQIGIVDGGANFGYGIYVFLPYLLGSIVIFTTLTWLVMLNYKKRINAIKSTSNNIEISNAYKRIELIKKINNLEELNQLIENNKTPNNGGS